MKYLCINCNYLYDEAIWDDIEWIEPWTKIDHFEYCPSCQEYDTFSHINEEVYYLSEQSFDSIENDHNIEIKKNDFDIEVIISENNHPMWDDHRIAWIWLYDEYSDLVDEKFLKVDDDSVVVFDDYDLDEFEVRIKCTQHKIFAKKFVLND